MFVKDFDQFLYFATYTTVAPPIDLIELFRVKTSESLHGIKSCLHCEKLRIAYIIAQVGSVPNLIIWKSVTSRRYLDIAH